MSKADIEYVVGKEGAHTLSFTLSEGTTGPKGEYGITVLPPGYHSFPASPKARFARLIGGIAKINDEPLCSFLSASIKAHKQFYVNATTVTVFVWGYIPPPPYKPSIRDTGMLDPD